MIGRNRIREIEQLFNIKFELTSGMYKNNRLIYVTYLNKEYFIIIHIYQNKIIIWYNDHISIMKSSEFYKVLQLIHEYLYDYRNNN